ncbi:MAG: putative Mg2+ transporter-C (MgtC) family protein [Gaiellaceae bacterium]|nr:putative Mg2+ transporter-C (MgtC) family protein [Gaiellaceae bacterium]
MLSAVSVPTLSSWEILWRVVLAAALGGAVGIERELRDREAGLRTHLLVSVGSALFTLVSAYGFSEFVTGGNVLRTDPTRIAAQIVSGIGFLGAGAIIRQGISVRGLTTASTLWVVAAIGLASGAGYWQAAVITTVVTIISLWPLRLLAFRMFSRLRADDGRLLVELPEGSSPAPVIAATEETGARIVSLQVGQEDGHRRIEIVLELAREHDAAELVAHVAELEDVIGVKWSD